MKKVGTYSTEEIKAIEKAFAKNFDTLKGPGWKKSRRGTVYTSFIERSHKDSNNGLCKLQNNKNEERAETSKR